jgi:hypothetical protein
MCWCVGVWVEIEWKKGTYMGCPICLNPEATESLHNRLPPNRQMRCLQCGDFGISVEAIEVAARIKTEDRWRVSAWVREYSPAIVQWEDIEQALKASLPGLLHRANRMLQAILKNRILATLGQGPLKI